MHLRLIAVVAILMALIAAPAASEEPEAPSEWQYDAVLYGWLAGLQGTIGFGDAVEEPVEAEFDDLLGYLDFALAGRFEARNSSWMVETDISYTNLGAKRDAQVEDETVSVELDIVQWIVEVGGGYRVTEELLILLAGRYYLLDTGLTSSSVAGGQTGEADQGWGDIYVGARYSKVFGEKWFASIRGDIGAGGSDLALFGEIGFGYRFSDLVSAAVGWRVLSLDYTADSESHYFKYDVVENGLGVALGFSF